MSHLHINDKDWAEAMVASNYTEDLFECKDCTVEFSLESAKIKDKKIYCPVCKKELKAWQKEWEA